MMTVFNLGELSLSFLLSDESFVAGWSQEVAWMKLLDV